MSLKVPVTCNMHGAVKQERSAHAKVYDAMGSAKVETVDVQLFIAAFTLERYAQRVCHGGHLRNESLEIRSGKRTPYIKLGLWNSGERCLHSDSGCKTLCHELA